MSEERNEWHIANRLVLVLLTWPALWVTAKGLWSLDAVPVTEVDGLMVCLTGMGILYIVARAAWLFVLETIGEFNKEST